MTTFMSQQGFGSVSMHDRCLLSYTVTISRSRPLISLPPATMRQSSILTADAASLGVGMGGNG